uniref:Uncharacterized protein n=1 Tax=Octopus bimaculoides TaxID=37653 RepID=A0A0L8G0U8_OCTBM
MGYWFTTTLYSTVADIQPYIHHILIYNLSHNRTCNVFYSINHSVNSTFYPSYFDVLTVSQSYTYTHIHCVLVTLD